MDVGLPVQVKFNDNDVLINRIPFGNPPRRDFFIFQSSSCSFMEIEEDNFRKTVSFAYQHSKFYKRNLTSLESPEKVKKPEDLGIFHDAEDLRANVGDFVCQRPDTAYETTGTL